MGSDLRDTKEPSRKLEMSSAKLIHRRRGRDPDPRDSNKGNKGRDKNSDPILDADDHESADPDCCDGPRAPLVA